MNILSIFLDVNKTCNCTAKYTFPFWCVKWWSGINETFCALNGGSESKYCPGARGLKGVDYYISSHPDVCSKAESKLSLYLICY